MKSMLKSLMSVAVAALAFTSCSNDATEDVMPNGGTKTLEVTASIDQTRTVMAANHVNLDWTDNDQIYLYIGENATQKTDAHVINAKTGGTITGVTYENGKTVVYANYSEGNSFSEGVKKAEIFIMGAQKQSKASEFAGNYLPMVAKGTITNGTVNLVFQPVGCVLVFNVYGQGKTAGEKLKSIKITTDVDCCGYKMCDLSAETLDYVPTEKNGTSATVTLTTAATIGTKIPDNTKVGENQVYLVVAPFNYEAATFTVTTDAGNTYTFKTANGIDCKTNTARVVNLNLAKAAELKPSIEITNDAKEQPSTERTRSLLIDGITFNNFTDEQIKGATVAVYSDEALQSPAGEDFWLKIESAATLSTGQLYGALTANTETIPRTAYIVITCGNVQSSPIAVTQVGAGSEPANIVETTYVPADMGYNDATAISSATLDGNAVMLKFDKGTGGVPKYYKKGTALRCYGGNTITVSGSKISKIEFVRTNDSDDNGKLSANPGTWSGNTLTWTGESNEVVLTVSGGQFRIKSMKITHVESNEPKIIVPTVEEKQPAEGSTLRIENIVFKNIDLAKVTTGVYSDPELANSLTSPWLTIDDSNLASGVLNCEVAANTEAERTAYIGIKYSETVKAAIAVTQKAQGAVDKYYVKVTENLEDWTGEYLIVYEKSDTEAYVWNFVDANNGYVSAPQSDLGILSNEATDNCKVAISKSGAGYLLCATAGEKAGQFIYREEGTNGLNFGTQSQAESYLNTITYETSYIKIESSGIFIKYLASGKRFRYYKTDQMKVQLYKLQE